MKCKYGASLLKNILDDSIIFLSFPVLFLLFISISLGEFVGSGLPIYFLQKRIGKKGKIFKIIKFRTMVINASRIQGKYLKLNEADGPAFKIQNDPRFTKFGKILSRTGLDELPQFINVLKGDMSIVGPRPLPINEARKLSKRDKIRELVKPGITSSWVVAGQHGMSFKKWMELDREYVQNASFAGDLIIILKTAALVFRFMLKLLVS